MRFVTGQIKQAASFDGTTGAIFVQDSASLRLNTFTLATLALVGASLVSFSIAERRYSMRYMAPAPFVVGD